MHYRREIDGLRALAVVPVIAFHAGIGWFSGGFVGVDVFFVISGYLITSIILAEQAKGQFSLVRFYERRARRILPALLLVVAVCIPVAWVLLLPNDYFDFSESLVAVAAFASNILFNLRSGYFEADAELKPLLHTWSLGVEEQFYLLFPLLLMGLARLGFRAMVAVLAAIGVTSFVAAEWGSVHDPNGAFFLLPFRAWELVVGALLALRESRFRGAPSGGAAPAPWRAEAASALGLAMVAAAVFLIDQDTPFPGRYALLPTLGTALLIVAATPATRVGRWLGHPALVAIGLMSYSAYLWHHPLFAFARHAHESEPSLAVLLALSAVSLVLAYLSWRFVEAPFRQKGRFSRRAVFGAALAGSLLVAGVGFVGVHHDGLPERFAFVTERLPGYRMDNRALQDESMAPLRTLTGDPDYGATESNAGDRKLTFNRPDARHVLIIGNSHSKDTYNLFVTNQERFPGDEFARFALQLGCISEQDPIGLFSSPNWQAADVILVSTKWRLTGCAPLTSHADDLDGVRPLLARARAEGKPLVLTTLTLEFPHSGWDTLADKIVVPALREAGRAPSATERAALKRRIDERHYQLRNTRAGFAERIQETNARLHVLASELGLPLLVKEHYMCDPVAQTCLGVTEDFQKAYYDYGHYTLDGARRFGARVAELGWWRAAGEQGE